MTALLSLLLTAGAIGPAAPSRVVALPPCEAQISIALDTEEGAFDGMSHSGALLVIRNNGPDACAIVALPVLRFEDAAGRALPVVSGAPAGKRPLPVVPLVAIAGGAEATAPLRWVSGDVYDGHNCLAPTRLVLGQGSGRHAAAFGFNLCGPVGKSIPVEQPALKTDPVLVEDRRQPN